MNSRRPKISAPLFTTRAAKAGRALPTVAEAHRQHVAGAQITTADSNGVYRLPESDWSRRVTLDHTVRFSRVADLPVYLRVTQADGHQAWSSQSI
jgi:hypothetical protein